MAYTTPQLLSTTSHHSPLPMFINKSPFTIHHSCPSNKRQIITCSSSKVPRFGMAHAMASKEIMQPYSMSTPFRSTTHHQSFAPSCDHQLVVVLENGIDHAAHMVDTALLECPENLEEKLSKVNVFSPLLFTIKQLFTNMDKVVVLSELLLLAEKSSITLNLRKMQIAAAENMQAEYWEEFPETPKEIFKAFTELIFSDNNLRASLTDASSDKLIEDPNALTMIQLWIRILINGLFHPGDKKPQKPKRSSPDFGKGPHAKFVYTFYYGSNNEEWIKEFKDKAKRVIEECIKDMINVHIELCSIREFDPEDVRVLSELINIGSGANQGPFSKPLKSWFKSPHACLQDYFKSSSNGRFVLTENKRKVLLNEEGEKILQVLEDFPQWKDDVGIKGFELSFIDYYKGN